MNLGDEIFLNGQLDFLKRRSHRPGLAAGVDDLVGSDTIEPGAEGGLLRVVGEQRPEDRKEDALGQVHGVLLVSGLAVDKDVDLIVVPLHQLLRRLTGAAALDVPYPLVLLLHGLTAFPY